MIPELLKAGLRRGSDIYLFTLRSDSTRFAPDRGMRLRGLP